MAQQATSPDLYERREHLQTMRGLSRKGGEEAKVWMVLVLQIIKA